MSHKCLSPTLVFPLSFVLATFVMPVPEYLLGTQNLNFLSLVVPYQLVTIAFFQLLWP